MYQFSVNRLAGFVAGGMIVFGLTLLMVSSVVAQPPNRKNAGKAAKPAKPKPKIPHVTWIKDQPAREWEIDDFEHVTATPHTLHVEYSRTGESIDAAISSYDVAITDHPANFKYNRKNITAKLLAANVVAVYLQTDQGKFWQRRDRLRKVDEDHVAAAEAKVVAPVVAKPAAAPEYRTWTDASGQHKTEAAFSGMIADQVKLVKKDGTKITLPMDKLSADDQAWIHKRSEAK